MRRLAVVLAVMGAFAAVPAVSQAWIPVPGTEFELHAWQPYQLSNRDAEGDGEVTSTEQSNPAQRAYLTLQVCPSLQYYLQGKVEWSVMNTNCDTYGGNGFVGYSLTGGFKPFWPFSGCKVYATWDWTSVDGNTATYNTYGSPVSICN